MNNAASSWEAAFFLVLAGSPAAFGFSPSASPLGFRLTTELSGRSEFMAGSFQNSYAVFAYN